MFAVVTFDEEGRSGIGGRFLDRIMPRRPAAQAQKAFGCEFPIVTLYDTAHERSWRRAELLAGTKCGQVVLPSELMLPEHTCLRRFEGVEEFLPLLVENTLVEVLERSRTPLYRRTVGLIDPDGSSQCMALRFLKHCSAIRVMTSEVKRYRTFSDQVMEAYGASVELCPEGGSMEECLITAAPFGMTREQAATVGGIVLSARPCPAKPRGVVVSALEIAPPAELLEVTPQKVSATDLAAALYELGGVSELGKLPASQGRLEGSVIRIGELAVRLRQRAGQL